MIKKLFVNNWHIVIIAVVSGLIGIAIASTAVTLIKLAIAVILIGAIIFVVKKFKKEKK